MTSSSGCVTGCRPVALANTAMESGLVARITFSKARFWSLSTSATDFMEVNQILGSPGLALYSPLAMGDSPRPKLILGHDTDDDGFHCRASLITRSTSAKKSSKRRCAVSNA